jgi:hypothetical protein
MLWNPLPMRVSQLFVLSEINLPEKCRVALLTRHLGG